MFSDNNYYIHRLKRLLADYEKTLDAFDDVHEVANLLTNDLQNTEASICIKYCDEADIVIPINHAEGITAIKALVINEMTLKEKELRGHIENLRAHLNKGSDSNE